MTQASSYEELYRELLTAMYGVRWEQVDTELPLDIVGRMWQPTLERDVMLINRWVTLLTFCIYTRPEAFDERLHAVGLQVRETLRNSGTYATENPDYLRISHPRIQAERYFFLLTRGWADDLRLASSRNLELAAEDEPTRQLLAARMQLGRHLMNYSAEAIITEAVLDAPTGRATDSQVEEWLARGRNLKNLRKHMRTLPQLHTLLKDLPAFKDLERKHFELFYNAAEKGAVQPVYAADALPQVAY